MKTKIILLSLLIIPLLQAAEDHYLPLYNSLGVFYPNTSKLLITVVPWDQTHEEISLRTKNSFINAKPFPVGDFVYLINAKNNNFNVEIIEYNQQLKKYNNPKTIKHDSLELNLQNCSYIVYNADEQLEYDDLSLAANLINQANENKVRCVINYPENKKLAILPLIKNKTVHWIKSWNDTKELWIMSGGIFGLLALAWYINPFNFLFI